MTTTLSIADYAKKINACWRKTADGVLETAVACAEAKKSLTKDDDRKALVDKLDFSAATFSKLVVIGECKALQTSHTKAILPPNYTIIYELAKLEDAELKRALSDGIVTPKMSRASLKLWSGVGSTKEHEDEVVFGTLRIKSDYDSRKKMQLEAELEKLKAKFDFEFERPKRGRGWRRGSIGCCASEHGITFEISSLRSWGLDATRCRMSKRGSSGHSAKPT